MSSSFRHEHISTSVCISNGSMCNGQPIRAEVTRNVGRIVSRLRIQRACSYLCRLTPGITSVPIELGSCVRPLLLQSRSQWVCRYQKVAGAMESQCEAEPHRTRSSGFLEPDHTNSKHATMILQVLGGFEKQQVTWPSAPIDRHWLWRLTL